MFFDSNNNPTTLLIVMVASIAGLAVGYASYTSGSKSSNTGDKNSKPSKQTLRNKPVSPSSSNPISPKENSELRGYKTTSDGKLTTYFNRELSEKDKALLGDSAPKRLDSQPLQRSDSGASSTSASAWNTAGTWEEKNYDIWASQKLQSLLTSVRINESGVSFSVDRVENIQGDAAVSIVRGKKRYIYDFSLDVHWQARIGAEKFSGVLHVADVSADCDYLVSNYLTCYPFDLCNYITLNPRPFT